LAPICLKDKLRTPVIKVQKISDHKPDTYVINITHALFDIALSIKVVDQHILNLFHLVSKMPHCLGCSTFFENLTTQQCEQCDSFESKPKENWRLCLGCGSIYEHLEADRCGRCLRASAPSGMFDIIVMVLNKM